MIYHREVLEKIGGFDENLDYGEDYDVKRRVRENGFEVEHSDLSVNEKFPDTLTEVWRQGTWYGKSFLKFFRKYPGQSLSLILTLFLASIPFVAVISIFSSVLRLLFLLQMLFVVYLSLEYYRSVGSPVSLAVPFLKIFRSFAIFLGMLEGLMTEDKGKS